MKKYLVDLFWDLFPYCKDVEPRWYFLYTSESALD